MDMTQEDIIVYLDIPARELQRYYEGSVSVVSVVAVDGRRIQFPAAALRPLISHNGVKGRFVIQVDAHNKLIGIRQIPD